MNKIYLLLIELQTAISLGTPIQILLLLSFELFE